MIFIYTHKVMMVYIYIHIEIHDYIYIHVLRGGICYKNLRCFFWVVKKHLQRQGSSYEAPGAAALNHCLKPPAQVGVDGPLGSGYSVWDVWLVVSRGNPQQKLGN